MPETPLTPHSDPEHSHPGHGDPDDLALRALGEELPDVDETHLSSCARCQGELDRLRAVVTTAREVQAEDHPVEPPPSVWAAVVAELGLSGTGDPVVTAGRRFGRRFGPAVLAAAVVVGMALGAVGTAVVSGGVGQDAGTVVATADLEPLPDRQGSGVAEVRGSGDSRELRVDVSGLTGDAEGYYEVWLLDKDAQRLVSLGVLEGNSGRFRVPATVDVSEYPVVDVSVEPVDGNPAHSGDSIVRGQLSG